MAGKWLSEVAMTVERYRRMLDRILTEVCDGIPEQHMQAELRQAKPQLYQLRETIRDSPSQWLTVAMKSRTLLISAARAVRTELGDDDLFIRSDISPAEHDQLIRWLQSAAPKGEEHGRTNLQHGHEQ
jgi:hypothetical protein